MTEAWEVSPENPRVREVEAIFQKHRMMSLEYIARAVVAWHIDQAGVGHTQETWQGLRELTARADRGDKLADNPEQQP